MTTLDFAELQDTSREPGTSRYSVTRIASSLGLAIQELADLAKVHRNTLRSHPQSPKLQSALRDLMRLLSAAQGVQPDLQRAVFLIKNAPIADFGHKTLMQMVEDGRTNDAIDYLNSISAGFIG